MGKRQMLKVVTALPLIGITSLDLSEDTQKLENGFTLVKREALTALKDFEQKRMLAEFGVNLSKVLSERYYLLVRAEHSFPPGGNKTLTEVLYKLSQKNGDRVDRFLVALKLIERLLTIRPDIRLNWFEDDYPRKERLVTSRVYHPISSFEGTPSFPEFSRAAKLTSVIDKVYSESDRRNSYPGVRIALDAMKTGIYAFNTSMRYLQEAIAIEALTSTDIQEVTHRVRVACSLLLASGAQKREKVYKQVGEIYKKRSSIIHGADIRVPLEKLIEIEQVSGKLLIRVLENTILPNFVNRDSQREFLLKLQLGKKM